ncbi:Uveal autoantigen with coiled-coil domains and ankyrin repeats [Chelonia mydas]|uniref:Uveal autoantigen with coiled-coil domains and ankyrin repeats n=1 Tax=Chelonia mydas TaxID=8469 RepID=M7BDL5_CHEMY|nr:Uveal autoantigen with coiled-coil domains and ankyrin repeats [Chelonia mydas]
MGAVGAVPVDEAAQRSTWLLLYLGATGGTCCSFWELLQLNTDWSKYDDRLMKAAERGDVEKISSILAKKGVNPTKLDVEGRSVFHVVASKGNLDCLNTILVHGVDIVASDAAAMSDCSSSIQLLCDHGAAVNAKDGDGRTPLVLATQMCRPTVCQLLIDRGADVNARDKQNRTALMLGCEYGCKDAVEVLLKNGADVSLVDALGHDCSYYARIGDNIDILALIKTAIEDSSKARELMKKGQPEQKVANVSQKRNPLYAQEVNFKQYQREQLNMQELEAENEDLKDRLKESQQEQRILLNRVSVLELQLNEKDELRRLLTAKEKQQEESLRSIEALKSKLRHYEHVSISLPTNLQTKSMLRPLELSLSSQSSSSENEILKRELDNMRISYGTAKEEIRKLQKELSYKVAECKALTSECERTKEESDGQIKQLEDALKDVQKRMFDSEGKVKQMQTHFLALKDHLTNEAAIGSNKLTEDLKDQLKDMKAKYEGASAEVGKLRNQIKQNELLVAEFRRDEGRLLEENKRLQKELGKLEMERENSGRNVVEVQGQLKEMAAKLVLSVPVEKFENMKSLLSTEVNEKAKKLVEMEREYEKLQAELRLLKREFESQKAKFSQYVRPEEHEQMRGRFEKKTEELEKTISELSKNQTLQKEVERVHMDNKLLKQQIHTLTTEIKSQYVPLKLNEEMKKTSDLTIVDLTKKLAEVTQKYNENKAEAEKLLMEKTSLSETVSHFQAVYMSPEKHEKEVAALKSNVVELKRQLAELHLKYDAEQAKVSKLVSENTTLRDSLNDQYVPAKTHEEIKTVLNSTLEKTNRELSVLKEKTEDLKREFMRVNEENGTLKKKLRLLQNHIQTEYVSLKDHENKVSTLNKSMQELQDNNTESLAKYKRGQEEILQLHAEIEAQKKELDTIQECIKSKYASVACFEERERNFEAMVKELKQQLLEQTQRCRECEEEMQKHKQENEKLKNGFLSMENDLQQNYILAEKSHEMEKMFTSKMEELNKQLRELLQKYTEIKHEKDKLQEESAKQISEALALQTRMQRHYVPVEQFEALKRTLGRTIEELKEDLNSKKACYDRELEKRHYVPVEQFEALKRTLGRTIEELKEDLNSKKACYDRELEKSEIQNTKQALTELESKEVVDMSEYKSMKSALETQVTSIAGNLASLNRKYEEMCEEALQAKKEELSAKDEKELLQSRSFSIEQEIKDQKERCDKSLTTITDLQKRIQESAKQVEAKDNKITELLNDVERLKQALNGLSQLTYTCGVPSKRQNQQVEMLQHQVKTLQQQLADADRQHQEVISIYRTHLLSAVQLWALQLYSYACNAPTYLFPVPTAMFLRPVLLSYPATEPTIARDTKKLSGHQRTLENHLLIFLMKAQIAAPRY